MKNQFHQKGHREEWIELRKKEVQEIKLVEEMGFITRMIKVARIKLKYSKLRSELRNRNYLAAKIAG